jgi:methanethiol S-methyltransferase
VTQHIILAFLWIVYCVLHSVLADVKVKAAVKNRFPDAFKYYRLFYTVFALFGFIAIILFQLNMTSTFLFRQTPFVYWTGVVVMITGAIIMLICIRKYFINLSGIRSLYEKIPRNELQITGVHKYVRHPLYLGTFVFIWGLLLVIPVLSLLISNLIITIYTVLAISFEEKKLEIEFGESYRQYKNKVPMLIPSRRNHL